MVAVRSLSGWSIAASFSRGDTISFDGVESGSPGALGFTATTFGAGWIAASVVAGAASAVKLALYGRRALAKDAGVSPEGAGSHRIAINSDAAPFIDPDGFVWEPARAVALDQAAAGADRRHALSG